MKIDQIGQFKKELQEQYPKLFKTNKKFWDLHFVSFVEDFLKRHENKVTIREEDDPHKVDRCPICKVVVSYGDNYCCNCGCSFNWR